MYGALGRKIERESQTEKSKAQERAEESLVKREAPAYYKPKVVIKSHSAGRGAGMFVLGESVTVGVIISIWSAQIGAAEPCR